MFLMCLDSIEDKNNQHKGVAVLCMAMISM